MWKAKIGQQLKKLNFSKNTTVLWPSCSYYFMDVNIRNKFNIRTRAQVDICTRAQGDICTRAQGDIRTRAQGDIRFTLLDTILKHMKSI